MHEFRLRDPVEPLGRLVQDPDRGIPQDGPGRRQPPGLAGGNELPGFPDPCVQPVRQGVHEIDQPGRCQRCPQFGLAGIRLAMSRFSPNGGRKQVGLLGEHDDGPAQVRLAQAPDVPAADADRSRFRVEEAHQQARQGGLAGPAFPDHGNAPALGDREAHRVERPRKLRPVAEAHTVEGDIEPVREPPAAMPRKTTAGGDSTTSSSRRPAARVRLRNCAAAGRPNDGLKRSHHRQRDQHQCGPGKAPVRDQAAAQRKGPPARRPRKAGSPPRSPRPG